MRIQVMQSGKMKVFRFFERFTYFILVIASVFHLGQSFSADSPSVHIQERISAVTTHENEDNVTAKENNNSAVTIVTGEEYLHIASGANLFGWGSGNSIRTRKKERSLSTPQKTIAKKERRKNSCRHNPVVQTRFCTTIPEHNNVQHISLSGQVICTVPGSHHQNFIFIQNTGYISTKYNNEYIFHNYQYLFSVFSKNIIDGGGIRPPPAHF